MDIWAETGYPKATLGENALVFLSQSSVSVWGPGQEDAEEWGGLLVKKMARKNRVGKCWSDTHSFYVFTEELA